MNMQRDGAREDAHGETSPRANWLSGEGRVGTLAPRASDQGPPPFGTVVRGGRLPQSPSCKARRPGPPHFSTRDGAYRTEVSSGPAPGPTPHETKYPTISEPWYVAPELS
jgi:hypothetical protein